MAPSTQNWRDYVAIDAGFPAAQQAQLIESLDSIWAAADDEGKALILSAGQGSLSDDGKLHIHPDKGNNYSSNDGIGINFMEIARLRFSTPEGERAPSLTGILVHELYHASDEILRGEVGASLARKALIPVLEAHGFSKEDARAAATEYWKHTTSDNLDYKPSPLLEAVTARVPSDAIRSALQTAGLIDAAGVVITEHNAAAFTDAFMEKNFGDQEPHRGRYRNFHREPAQPELPGHVTVPKLSGVVYPTEGFVADVPPGVTLYAPPVEVHATQGKPAVER